MKFWLAPAARVATEAGLGPLAREAVAPLLEVSAGVDGATLVAPAPPAALLTVRVRVMVWPTLTVDGAAPMVAVRAAGAGDGRGLTA